jgi:hypothetical protein
MPAPVLAVHVAIAGIRNLQKGPGNDGRHDLSIGRCDVGIRRKLVRCSTFHVFTNATRHELNADNYKNTDGGSATK